MNPILIGGLAYLLIKALANETNKKVSEFKESDIITDYSKFFKSTEKTKAKIHSTRILNKLIETSKKFKIGKSGDPKGRKIKHFDFEKMYVLVESENEKFINELEAHYNEKYISNKKNKNLKIGSAGKMTEKTGRYFLYFIISE
jgi:hypothetical protein